MPRQFDGELGPELVSEDHPLVVEHRARTKEAYAIWEEYYARRDRRARRLVLVFAIWSVLVSLAIFTLHFISFH